MSETIRITSILDDWINLFQAFCAVGEAEFGDAWEEDCWRLAPFDLDDIPPLANESKIDPAAYAENPHAWDDVEFATNDEIKQFDRVDKIFRKVLWEGGIDVRLIGSSGNVDRLEKSLWRSDLLKIYWLNSEVRQFEGLPMKLKSIWDAELYREDVERLASTLKKERRRGEVSEIRKQAATGERTLLYDWEFIDGVIVGVYQDDAPRNLRIGSGKVIKNLKQLGWGNTDQHMDDFRGIPSDSAIEKRIRGLKKVNKTIA
jgi:hypothetical protein